MKAIHPIKAGVTLAALFGGWHVCWVMLVATGLAQSVIDFVFWIHFIKPVYVIGTFNLAVAVVLIFVTTILGFVLGFVFSVLWNKVHLA
jgi:hypothetical protein